MDEICDKCGEQTLKNVGVVSSTRLFICTECFYEKHEFIGYVVCEHEFNGRDECVQCGKRKYI